ncbi:hypothetical protein MPTK1_6g20350 [Marchantia polymorpha subsp. ruderalis]|uniref:MalT-like TPR region domain-containing protein n=2 Tax=Marchantia polymorpha TaxID=3197 RepID=A0AAF6BU51_MARPO|nr:hypothetical protein MARPO_0045s0029 [Marchantia polymorpha]BBN15535.1 hypothetical protein Mp_6g20350 [Marchantia polymorpha subsp. ruderalis]|eukprot:PTQ39354.1 hypothetical protein MARPO_0045s0029 [Marchantia polymorpha]
MESTGLMRVGLGLTLGGGVGFVRPACNVRLEGRKTINRICRGGVALRVCRPSVTGRTHGWDREKMSGVGVVLIAARAFGVGRRGPSRPRITTPRHPVEEEESDESHANVDSRDDVTQGIVEVLDGESEGPITEDPANKSAQLLQDQFNRFAAAVALADRKMAEEIIKEMGDGESVGVELSDFSDGEDENTNPVNEFEDSAQLIDDQLYHIQNTMTTARMLSEESNGEIRNFRRDRDTDHSGEDPRAVEKQLEELYEEVGRMIEEGDEGSAREVIEANYEALLEQLEEGIRGVEQAAMLDILAQLYMNMGDYECADVLLDQTKEILDDISSPHPLLDNILEHVGSMYTGIGKPEEALPCYLRSLDIQESVFGKDSPLLVRTMLGLAKTYSELDAGSKSVELYQRSLVLTERSQGSNNEAVILILTHLGHTLLEEERLQEAEITLRRAVVVTQNAYGARDGRVGVATCALARAKSGQGEIDEAVRMYQQGLQIMEDCPKFSPDDPVIESVRTDMAEILNMTGRDTEAQLLWEENLRVKERELGKNDVQLVPHLNNLATSYAHSQLFDKCEPLLRRSLKLMTIHFGPKAPQISVSLELLATALHHLGRGFEAEPLAREALAIREAHYGPDHPNTGQACNCLAAVLHGLDKDSESEVYLRRVLKIQEKELGPECPEIILTLELLVMLLDKQGRQNELPPIIRRLQRLEAMITDESNNEE